jgi:6,7-dimethyl-8-ribityllumazine synthase
LQELEAEFVEFRVAGVFEIPTAAKKVLLTQKFSAVITLGVVVRGETSHYDFVAGNAARKVADLGVEFATPVIFGILTTEDTQQAEARGNLGKDYAEAAVEMVKTLQEIEDAKI